MTCPTDKGIQHLTGLTNLRTLSLQSTDIETQSLNVIKNFTNLTCLNLCGCRFIQDSDAPLIAELKNLTYLNISYNQSISNFAIPHLAQLPNLVVLDLIGCFRVNDNAIPDFEKFPSLQKFDFGGRGEGEFIYRRITDEGVARLTTAINQRMLGLGGDKAKFDSLDPETFVILQMLRDNIMLWTDDEEVTGKSREC